PLRHSRHRHQVSQRNAYRRAQQERDHDPLVGDYLMPKQRSDDRYKHPDFARQHAAARRRRRVHPFQRQDEQPGSDEIAGLDRQIHQRFSVSRFLNIFSIRSVMRYPLTTLIVDAVTATKPKMRLSSVASWAPVIRIAPTTAIAEIA